jgi:hypothetical protein
VQADGLNRGFVFDFDAEVRGGVVVGVEQGFAAAEEEGVGARELQGAAEGGLPAHAVALHPFAEVLGLADGLAGQGLVGLAAGDLEEVLVELVLGVVADEVVVGADVHLTDVAGVAAVAAAEVLGRGFEDEDAAAGSPRFHGGAERGVAATDYHDID